MFESPVKKEISRIKESATLAINHSVKELRKNKQHIVHFGFGQSPFSIHTSIRNSLIRHAANHQYLPTQGLPELCQAVAKFLEQEFDYCYQASDIFIGPGSKTMLFNLLLALDGTVLIPAPSWVSYGPQAELLQKPLEYLPCFADSQYCLSAETLQAYCQSNPTGAKVLILNSPNNPTGQVYPAELLAQLSEVCQQYNITVISDEIYALNCFDNDIYTSMSHYYPQGTIVTSGLSKSFGGGGYRLGYAAIPSEQKSLARAMLTIASETYSAVTAPVQYAALDAYENFESHKDIIQRSNAILKKSALYCWQQLRDMNVSCPRPQGAFYLMPDFSAYQQSFMDNGIKTDKALASDLLKKAGVATLPGSDFYMREDQFTLRLSPVDFDGDALLTRYTTVSAIEQLDMKKDFPNIIQGCEQISNYLAALSS